MRVLCPSSPVSGTCDIRGKAEQHQWSSACDLVVPTQCHYVAKPNTVEDLNVVFLSEDKDIFDSQNFGGKYGLPT